MLASHIRTGGGGVGPRCIGACMVEVIQRGTAGHMVANIGIAAAQANTSIRISNSISNRSIIRIGISSIINNSNSDIIIII